MKSENVKIDGVSYVVNELTLRDVLPLMDEFPPEKLTFEISKKAVTKDGQPLGEAVLDFPFSAYQLILTAVNKVHGFGSDEEKGDETKND